MKYCLDADTLIFFLNHERGVVARLAAVPVGNLFVSVISAAEIYAGFEKSPGQLQAEQRFAEFLGSVNILPFDLDDARAAAKVRAILEKSGLKIGAYDLQIAGQALQRGLTLVTHNVRQFKRVPGLAVEDWMG